MYRSEIPFNHARLISHRFNSTTIV